MQSELDCQKQWKLSLVVVGCAYKNALYNHSIRMITHQLFDSFAAKPTKQA